MKFDPFYAYVNSPTYETPQVYTTLLEDVLFCPVNNIILRKDRKIVKESAGPGRKTFGVDQRAIFGARDVEPIDGLCTSFRSSFDNYYHLLIDHLSRFDLLNHEYFAQFDEIKLLCPGGLRSTEQYFVAKLLPCNVKIVSLEKGVLYRPEKYLFNSFLTQRASAYIPGPFIDRIQERTRPSGVTNRDKRIYVSRADARHRKVLNEDDLVSRLQKYGFEVYCLSNLSLHQQIDLFHSAEIVVAPHGAGLSNLLFSEKARVLELHPPPTVATHFYMLSKRKGHQYEFVVHEAKETDSDFHANPCRIEEKINTIM